MFNLNDNRAILEVLKANIYLSQCILTMMNDIIIDFKLENTDKQNVYKNKILKNISNLKVLSGSLGHSLQVIIESLDMNDDQDTNLFQ